ncbi:MAG: alkane 1-monooxygenase [Myxococcota bacterium]
MVSSTAPAETSVPRALPVWGVARVWLRHLLSLYIPAVSLGFLYTGPHVWYLAIPWMFPLVVAHQLDCAPWSERRQPDETLPDWPFDLLVYVLAGLQLWIVAATVELFTRQAVFSVDMAMVLLLVGGASGFSIITAHELIHRKRKAEQWLGRLLLSTVLYEHFYTEHLRGHHVRVGTPADPATARFGESYEPFFRRTVPAQFRSAWRLEARRLGDEDMPLLDPRHLRNRVLHGLVFEWGLAFGVLFVFGVPSFVAFLLQAFMAVRLLEAVNYFEHWGLQRRAARVRPVDSWDTHSAFTYYGLVGLSRHADHHAWPARPYPQLRVFDEAPLLPIGYVGLVDQVMAQNQEFMHTATDELARRRLGPFTPEEGEPTTPLARDEARAKLAEAQRAEASKKPARKSRLRLWHVLLGIVLFTALGAHLESGGMPLLARVALHGWILAVVALVIWMQRRIREHLDYETLAFGVGFAVMIALGLLTDGVLAAL